MKLYVVELSVLDKSSKKTIGRIPVTLNGDDKSADEGSWSVPKWAAVYVRQTSGYWYKKYDSDGMSNIGLYEAEDPNMISWLWRDTPQGIAVINDILKLPLFTGETGTGYILSMIFMGNMFGGYSFNWRVIERGF